MTYKDCSASILVNNGNVSYFVYGISLMSTYFRPPFVTLAQARKCMELLSIRSVFYSPTFEFESLKEIEYAKVKLSKSV